MKGSPFKTTREGNLYLLKAYGIGVPLATLAVIALSECSFQDQAMRVLDAPISAPCDPSSIDKTSF